MRGLEAGHVTAEFRQSQPVGDLALENAALAEIVARTAALAGNHQNELDAVALHPAQKRKQRGMGLGLRLAVKIEPGDRLAPARKPLLEPPLDLLGSRLTSISGIIGLDTGSGMCLPASIMSSSRGSSMTKRPAWRMRPAIRAASSPAPQ